jgi:hypothetical protein
MIQYWTFWNFNWYLGSELGICSLNGALRTSIINTSIIGGFMTYIYPRKIVVKNKENQRYDLPYYKVVLLDLIFHQLPLVRLLHLNYIPGICGFYALAPVSLWFLNNSLNDINVDKIYGIKMNKLCITSLILTSIYSIVQHKKLISK